MSSLRSCSAALLCIAAAASGCGKKRSDEKQPTASAEQPPTEQTAPDTNEPFVCPKGDVEFCGQSLAPDAIGVICQDPQVDDLRPLACLTSLEVLTLTEVSARDLSPIASLSKLDQLVLLRLPAESIKAVSELRQLQGLELRQLPVRDLSALTGLKQLTRLELQGLPTADLTALSRMNRLAVLGLREMNLPDLRPIASLPIETLSLTRSTVSDLRPLGQIRSLKTLYARRLVAPAGQLDQLKRQLPSLSVEGTAESKEPAP